MQNRDEDKLQAALVELISLRKRPGVLAWAVNNNPRNVIDGARYKRLGMVRGVPDLHFIVNRRYQTLEVKTKKGRSTPEQLAWAEALRAGGIYADIGHGWDECVDILQRRGVLLPGTYGKLMAVAGPADKDPKKRKPAVRPSLEPGEISLGNAVPLATQDVVRAFPGGSKGSDLVGGQVRRNEPKKSLQSANVPLAGSDDPKGPSI